jgi:hydroxymethylglutaryl-CoA lyase
MDTSQLPQRVEIHEEGPREGFQIEPAGFSVEQRVALVHALAEAGLRQIQVASFVSPRRVPQMADADRLFAALHKRAGVRYTALWLNEAGFERARACPQVDLAGTLYFYASDAFSRQNSGCGAEEQARRQVEWVWRYHEAGIAIESAYVMTAFGCNFQGEVSEAELARVLDFIATLLAIARRIELARSRLPGVRIGLHLHDTRGLGMANALAALQQGVDLFDASVAGLGGCPFCGHAHGGASGNVCTEDLAFMCEEMGIATGLDLEALLEAARLAERTLGRRLDGKLMHAGTLRGWRAGLKA